MDPFNNPFAPGAGSKPPELAGREVILSQAELACRRFWMKFRTVGKAHQTSQRYAVTSLMLFAGWNGTSKCDIHD